MEFRKGLAKYYRIWYANAIESVAYCELKGDNQKATQYQSDADTYKRLIEENEKAIDFFSIGDNAYLLDGALPVEFRGYK